MDINYRDNAIAKNRLFLKLTFAWALLSSIAVIVLTALCFYTVKHREVHWLPIGTCQEFSIGDDSYSPSYLKDMSERAADLRLTYNPETIEARYRKLAHLISSSNEPSFKKLLDAEQRTVQDKNVTSVFYSENEKTKVDMAHHEGQVEGFLHRTSHGLPLKPVRKIYRLKFTFKNGLLSLSSIEEIQNAR